MLLPEEEEYNKAKKEFDRQMSWAEKMYEKVVLAASWGYNFSYRTLERYLLEIKTVAPARRIIEEKRIDVKSVLGGEVEQAPTQNFSVNQIMRGIIQKYFPFLLGNPPKQLEATEENTIDVENRDGDNEANNDKENDNKDEIIYDRTGIVFGLDDYYSPKNDDGNEGLDTDEYFNYDEISSGFKKLKDVLNESLQKVLKASEELDEVYDKKLGDQPSGNLILKTTESTSVRDDYRQETWGTVRRVCLDGIQNHLPHDSLGTKCYVQFLIGNNWVDAETAKANRNRIKEVRFVDNGVGFYYDSLIYLGSDKGKEEESTGQFGEGLKLISMASLNMGLGIEIQSRNWRAKAIPRDITTINTRKTDAVEERKALSYDIEVYDGEPIIGSKTIFHTPTKEFIDFALDLPSKVVELMEKKPLSIGEYADIIDSDEGGIAFVKGVYLCDFKSILQYNFKKANVNPNRNSFVNSEEVQEAVRKTLTELENFEAIKILLRGLIKFEKENAGSVDIPIEYNIGREFSPINTSAPLWNKAFYEVCDEMGLVEEGQEPIVSEKYKMLGKLGDEEELDEVVIPKNYKVVNLPKLWVPLLKEVGVRTELDIIPDYSTKVISTNIDINSVDVKQWNRERILIDVVQNHLPADSGANKVFIRFKTSDGRWFDYTDLRFFKDEDIVEIKICDDGAGYDYRCLGYITSTKDGKEEAGGRFGEGLKKVAQACYLLKEKIMYKSRKWMAEPGVLSQTLNEGEVNEKNVDILAFYVKRDRTIYSHIFEDGDGDGDYFQYDNSGYSKYYEKSATVFYKPSPELIAQFRHIDEKVLYFSDYKPITEVGDREVLETRRGKLFVRGLLIPGNHGIKFSYNLKNYTIASRDRNVIPIEDIQKEIKTIFENTTDERFIEQIYDSAQLSIQHEDYSQFAEFTAPLDITSNTPQADAWIKVFKEMFGDKDVGIRSVSDSDFNAVHRAEHLGIKIVTLPDNLYRALRYLKGRNGEEIPSYDSALNEAIENAIQLDDSMLTEKELEAKKHLYEFNKIMKIAGYSTIDEIQVFKYPDDYFGTRAAGYHNRFEDNKIYISTDTLNSAIPYMANVFFHEAAHVFTNAEDAEKAFRDCLSTLLGTVATVLCPTKQSVEELAESLAMKNSIEENVSIIDSMIAALTELRDKLLEGTEESIEQNIGDDTKKELPQEIKKPEEEPTHE